MKKILLLLFLAATLSASSQTVAGYWYGTASVANTTSASNYLVELILKQNNTAVQGIINYYFKNTYRSIQVKGSYNANTRQLSLVNIPVPWFGSRVGMEVDCPMDLLAFHRVAKAGSNLTGKFVGREGYRGTCPDINFDLRLNNEAGNEDSILTALRNFKETYQLWTPSAYDTLVAATVYQRPIQNPVVVDEFKQRKVEVQNEIEVEGDSISVDFYDNGEVDGDSISVFFNEKLLGANLRLSTRAVHMDLKLDSTLDVHTLAMFANNLGALPPNTALMLISDGKKRYEVRLSSNLDSSGAIRIRKKKQ